MVDRYLELLLRHRYPFLGLVVVLVIAGLFGAAALPIRIDPEEYHDPASRAYKDYSRFLESFGSDKSFGVMVELPDGIGAPGELDRLDAATDRLEALGWFEHVLSVANVVDLQPAPDGAMRLEPMLPRGASDEELKRAIARIVEHPVYGGSLIDTDGRYALIRMAFWEDVYQEHEKDLLVRTIERELRPVYPDEQLHFLGIAFISMHLMTAVEHDRKVLLLGALLVAMLSLGIAVREPRRCLILGANALVSVILALGLFRLIDGAWTTASALIPLVVVIYSLADSIHILAHFDRRFAATGDQRRAAKEATRALFLACVLTSFTTIVGFLTLGLSPQVPIRELGFGVALGIAAAFAVDVALTPTLLSLVPLPRRDRARQRPLAWALPRASLRRPWAMIGALVLVTGGTAFGLSQLTLETNILRAFPADNPVRTAMHAFESELGGTLSYEVLIDGKAPGAFEDPALLERLSGLQPEIAGWTEVTHVLSLAEVLERYRALASLPPPASKAEAAEVYLFASFNRSGLSIYDFIDHDHQTARLTVRTGFLGAEAATRLAERLEARVAAAMGPDAEIIVTGSAILFSGSIVELVRSFLRSLLLAVVLVTAVFIAICGSLRWGLLFALPNVMAILIAYAVMGPLGIEFNFTTATIGSVALGIAVDDTIHVLLRLKAARARGTDGTRALARALYESCTGITLTSLTLVAGLSVGMLSDLTHTVWLCVVLMVAVLAALVYNLALVPALVRLLPLPPLDASAAPAGARAAAPLDAPDAITALEAVGEAEGLRPQRALAATGPRQG